MQSILYKNIFDLNPNFIYSMKARILTAILGGGLMLMASFTSVAQPVSYNGLTPYNGPKFGQDSVSCITNISLYREFYKQGNFKDALKPWRYVFTKCPLARETTFLDGIKIIDYKIKTETNPELKKKYIDTLGLVYDSRIMYFPLHYRSKKPQEGYILGRKGVDMYLLRPDASQSNWEILKKSIEIEGTESQADVMVYYLNTTIKLANEGKFEKTAIVDAYDQLSSLIDVAENNAAGDSVAMKNWENVRANIESSFEPYANCENIISIYQAKFEADPKNIDLLKKITKILDRKRCTGSKLFFDATSNLHKLEPTANSASMMAKMNIKEEKWSQALEYLKQSLELYSPEESDKKAEAYYLMGFCNLSLKSFSAGKQAAIKAIELKPYKGDYYMLLGDLYASGASACGGDDIEKRAGYWAAVDKYYQAKKVDSSVAAEADKRINSTSSAFPTSETLFFYGMKPGQSYQVGCWINESTTIRASR